MSTPTEPTDEPDADMADLPPADGQTRDEHDPWEPLPIPQEDEHGDQ